jgi:hypothetical protein
MPRAAKIFASAGECPLSRKCCTTASEKMRGKIFVMGVGNNIV